MERADTAPCGGPILIRWPELASSESMYALLADYTATTVRIRDGKRHLHDGPYADTAEQVGGYIVIDVANLDRALEWVEKCPAASSGAVEIRPLCVDCVSDCLR